MNFLEINSVCKNFGDIVALASVSMTVTRGSRTAIVGPSGSGKSTLLRVIAGFEQADTGSVTLDGQLVSDPVSVVPTHRRDIGIVSQHGALFPHLSIAANIGFGLPRAHPDRENRIDNLLATVELDPVLRNRRPDQLSGGQQQRVALARALARNPRLMLLDEPFSSLDTELRESMREEVGRILHEAGIATILVTHDQVEAMSFADQLVIMKNGRLVQAGAPELLYARPVDPATALFLGDALIFPATVRGRHLECFLGELVADTTGHNGEFQAMLRNEQIRLEPVTEHEQADTVCYGRVQSRSFAGSSCSVSIALESERASAEPLQLRLPTPDTVEPGTRIRILARGAAHVFAPAH